MATEEPPVTSPPPVDGITTLVRRATSVAAFVFFFGLLVADYVFGIVVKDIPIFIYCLLASLAVVAHDKFFDLMQIFKGGTGK